MNEQDQITVPDFMPVLQRGCHSHPSKGACLMEYISVLAGERFSDHPRCVYEQLAEWGRNTNDALPDESRHLLLPLVHRFIGTNLVRPETQTRLELEFLRHGGRMMTGCCTGCSMRRCRPEELVRWLTEALDIYDRVTHRERPARIHEDRLREATDRLARAEAPVPQETLQPTFNYPFVTSGPVFVKPATGDPTITYDETKAWVTPGSWKPLGYTTDLDLTPWQKDVMEKVNSFTGSKKLVKS